MTKGPAHRVRRRRWPAAAMALACASLVGVIAASRWLGCGVGAGPVYLGLGRGLVSAQRPVPHGLDASWRWWRYEDKPLLWLPFWVSDETNAQVFVPLWPAPLALAGMVALSAWRRARR